MERMYLPGSFPDRRDAARQALRDFGRPVVALATDLQPAPGHLTAWEGSNDQVTAVTITYAPGGPQGPWVGVESSHRESSGELRRVVERHLRMRGEYLPEAEWAHGLGTVIVNGLPVTAETVRAGTVWWAAQCEWEDIQIRIVAHDWKHASPRVQTVTDLEPLLAGPGWTLTPPEGPWMPEEETPGSDGREPHLVLVDAVLRHSSEHARWRAEGGPAPRLPRSWGQLWRAAVRRQEQLAGQSEAQAELAVEELTSHLSSLQTEAAWFRTEDRLRERAIAETLLYQTEISLDVPSAAAHDAWRRRRADPPPHHAHALEPITAHQDWEVAWTAWAQVVRGEA